tara:strand:+ start:240 stop:587 length:348 start_codon:yes stop_codon:yes gene_type:complete
MLIDKKDKRYKKHKKFKKANGFSPCETWALDSTIARFIAPRLRYLAFKPYGYPMDFEYIEDWQEVLYKMVAAFDIIVDEERFYDFDCDKERAAKDKIIMEEGLDLFRKYYFDLWS